VSSWGWVSGCLLGWFLIVGFGLLRGRGRLAFVAGLLVASSDSLRCILARSSGLEPAWWWGSSGLTWPVAVRWLLALSYLSWAVWPFILVGCGASVRCFVATSLVTVTAAVLSWVVPVAPPWMVGMPRSVEGLPVLGALVLNDVSPATAFPSVHVAIPFVLALVAGSWRWSVYGAVVAVVVVLAGEHWLVDVAGGVVLALAVWAAMIAGYELRRRAGPGRRGRIWSRHNLTAKWGRMRKGVAG